MGAGAAAAGVKRLRSRQPHALHECFRAHGVCTFGRSHVELCHGSIHPLHLGTQSFLGEEFTASPPENVGWHGRPTNPPKHQRPDRSLPKWSPQNDQFPSQSKIPEPAAEMATKKWRGGNTGVVFQFEYSILSQNGKAFWLVKCIHETYSNLHYTGSKHVLSKSKLFFVQK